MAGLGILIYGALRAICGVGQAVENKQMKDFSYRYTDKGEPTWIDRDCNRYINGEKVIATYDYKNQKLVYAGKNSGKVYFDPEQATNQRMIERDKKELKMEQNFGNLAYNKWNPIYKRNLTTEISTGKIIAALYENEYKNIYRKFYLKSMPVSEYGKTKADPGDFGVPISKNEYKKLNIIGSTCSCVPDFKILNLIGTDEDPYKDVHPE